MSRMEVREFVSFDPIWRVKTVPQKLGPRWKFVDVQWTAQRTPTKLTRRLRRLNCGHLAVKDAEDCPTCEKDLRDWIAWVARGYLDSDVCEERLIKCPNCDQRVREWQAICPCCQETLDIVAAEAEGRLELIELEYKNSIEPDILIAGREICQPTPPPTPGQSEGSLPPDHKADPPAPHLCVANDSIDARDRAHSWHLNIAVFAYICRALRYPARDAGSLDADITTREILATGAGRTIPVQPHDWNSLALSTQGMISAASCVKVPICPGIYLFATRLISGYNVLHVTGICSHGAESSKSSQRGRAGKRGDVVAGSSKSASTTSYINPDGRLGQMMQGGFGVMTMAKDARRKEPARDLACWYHKFFGDRCSGVQCRNVNGLREVCDPFKILRARTDDCSTCSAHILLRMTC
jgi:hypothetical protein